MLLEIKYLTFGYQELPVVKDFSLSVTPGEILLVSGRNGVGKTTLLNCITGLVNQGRCIYYDGKEAFGDRNLLKNNSYIMSDDTLYDYLTMAENIRFYKNLFQGGSEFMGKISEYTRLFGLEEYADMLVKNLSQGTRNKLYIAIMLAKKHGVLLLDEPFTALDAATQKVMLETLKTQAGDRVTVMVTHIEEFKRIATREIILEKMTSEQQSSTPVEPDPTFGLGRAGDSRDATVVDVTETTGKDLATVEPEKTAEPEKEPDTSLTQP